MGLREDGGGGGGGGSGGGGGECVWRGEVNDSKMVIDLKLHQRDR